MPNGGSIDERDDIGALDQFDALVADVMAEWQIPGVAMAVVREG